jgi:hypothetical protein
MRDDGAKAPFRSRVAALVILVAVALGGCLLACGPGTTSAVASQALTGAGRETVLPGMSSSTMHAPTVPHAGAVVADAGDGMCGCCADVSPRAVNPAPAPTPRTCSGPVPHAPPTTSSMPRSTLVDGIEPVPKTLSELSQLRI